MEIIKYLTKILSDNKFYTEMLNKAYKVKAAFSYNDIAKRSINNKQ